MKEFYKLIITKTSAETDESPTNETFDVEAIEFENLNAVKNYLKDNYKKVVPQPIFVDNIKTKETIRIGWVFSFWNSDVSHNSKNWWQEDWIEILKFSVERPIMKNKDWKIYSFEKDYEKSKNKKK